MEVDTDVEGGVIEVDVVVKGLGGAISRVAMDGISILMAISSSKVVR